MTGDVVLVKSDIGLGNVDNTSDSNKPVSTATQLALDLKVDEASLADVATSGSYADLTNKPAIPTISDATSTTKGIMRLTGDLGGTADAPTVMKTYSKADVGLGNVDNTNDLTKPVSTATQQALNARISKVTSSDEALVRFDGTTGAVQNSGVLVDDSNNVSIPGNLVVSSDQLYVNPTTKRVGIGTNSPDAKLKVVSSNSDPGMTINASGGRVLQAQVNGDTKFFVDGSGFFRIGSLAAQPAGVIHVDLPTAGNLSDSMIGLTVRGRTAQTGDLLQLQDANSNVMFGVDAAGKARMPAAPTAATHVTNKQYVDTAVGSMVSTVSASGTQGVTASVTNPSTTPAITVGLGAITPTSVTTTGNTQSLQHIATNGTFTTTLASNNLSFNRAGASYIDQSAAAGSIIIRTRDTAGTGDLNRLSFTSGNTSSIQVSNANLNLSDGVNVDLGTTTGSKIGTATTQKIGFFNATPVVQPSATTDLGTALANLGLRAAGTGYSLSLSGSFASTGSVRSSVTGSVSATTLTTASVEYQLCNAAGAAYTITLPSTTTVGYRFTIKKVDATANAVTVAGNIDGATNYVLATQYKYVTVISTVTAGTWLIVGGN